MDKLCKRRLILISDRKDFPKTESREDCFWVFLGRKYDRLNELKKTAPKGFQFIDIGDLIYDESYKLRRPYLDYIGSLSSRFSSLSWWVSRISEKNVMVSPVFLYLCYLKIIVKLANEELRGRDLCVFSESPELLNTIAKLPVFSNYSLKKSFRSNLMNEYLFCLIRLSYFIAQSFCRKILAISSRLYIRKTTINKKSSLVVMRTWVNDKNLGENGVFNDSYFVNLYDYLKIKSGLNVAIIPILYNIERPLKQVFRWFRESSSFFIIPEDFYHFSDYIKSIYISFRSSLFFRDSFDFMGLDLSLIFREEARKTLFEPGALQVIMHYFLIKRLKAKDLKIENFIFTFENMFPEKPLILGIERFYPGAQKIGFQHSVLFPLLLSLYVSNNELGFIPMPDKIICSGKFSMNKMIEEGYPSTVMTLGPALRFQHLLGSSKNDNEEANLVKVVLIALPLSPSGVEDVLFKAWQALLGFADIKIKLKAHPMMSKSELSSVFNKLNIVENKVESVRGPMKDILPKIDLMIAAASGAVLDAIAYGVPVIRVRQDLDLNLDPMDWFPRTELQFVARTAQELKNEIRRALSLDRSQLKQLKVEGKSLIEQCFSPVEEKVMAVFMG
ncbi:MAG: hypothetical protein HQ564_03600 [Candidatus Saganbacteria bacterium]|nr:hypothetical protein [Candidatus Saganbacteria bacterium]